MAGAPARVDGSYPEVVAFAAPSAPARFYAAHLHTLLGTGAVILFLAVWQWAGTSGTVNPLFSSSPSRILATFHATPLAQLATDLGVSGGEFLAGFVLAVLVGIPLGILVGWYRPLAGVLEPFITVLNATPRVALLPMLMIWLGIGTSSKIAVVFIGAFLAVLINTTAGVKSLDPALLQVARSFGASSVQLFRTIALPGSVPFILSGMRLGLGHALIGIIVGELYGAKAGIGYRMSIAVNTYQTDKVFMNVMIIAGAGLAFTAALRLIETRFQAWRPTGH